MKSVFAFCFLNINAVLVLGFTNHHRPTISGPITSSPTRTDRGRCSPIFAVELLADAEKEEIEKETLFDASWIPTSNGGFLPRIRGKRKLNVVHEITSLQEYKQLVADEKEKLVVVRFYAPWCRACKAIASVYKQLASTYPNVKFVEVPLTKETGMIHQGLGVPSLPFGHIYHPEAGLVEERRISKKHFNDFRDRVLQSYVDGYCLVKYHEDGTHTQG